MVRERSISFQKEDYNINKQEAPKIEHGCKFSYSSEGGFVSCYSEASYRSILRVVGSLKNGFYLFKMENGLPCNEIL